MKQQRLLIVGKHHLYDIHCNNNNTLMFCSALFSLHIIHFYACHIVQDLLHTITKLERGCISVFYV